MKDECIDGAEDGGIGADANGQRNHGNRGEARPLDEIPYRVANITEKRFHNSSLSGYLPAGRHVSLTHIAELSMDRPSSRGALECSKPTARRLPAEKKHRRTLKDRLGSLGKACPRALSS